MGFVVNYIYFSCIFSLELSPPVHETDSARIKGYLEGTLESDVKSFTSVVVMGLFGKENKKGSLKMCWIAKLKLYTFEYIVMC